MVPLYFYWTEYTETTREPDASDSWDQGETNTIMSPMGVCTDRCVEHVYHFEQMVPFIGSEAKRSHSTLSSDSK